MFYYTDQLPTPSFPTGLVKIKSGFTVGLVETSSGKWTLVIAVISVDAYPFLAFSDLTCHLEDTGIGVSGCTMSPDSKETELGSSNQEASPSAGKNTRIALVPCHARKCVLSEEFSVRVKKITSKIGVLWTHSLPFSFWQIFNSINYGHIIKRM